MARDGIRIVEFDEDGQPKPAAGTGEGQGDRPGMKIVEFDDDREDGGKSVVTAQGIGPIRIVEFDDDAPPAPAAALQDRAPPPRAIKIRDFGAEAESSRPGEPGTGRKIKIMEFDR